MLRVVLPLANVLVSIWQNHRPISIFLSLFEVANVASAILVGKLAFALEQVLREVALVCAL